MCYSNYVGLKELVLYRIEAQNSAITHIDKDLVIRTFYSNSAKKTLASFPTAHTIGGVYFLTEKHAYYYWLSLIRKESYDKAVSNLPSTLPVNESHSIVEISKTGNRIGCAGIRPADHPSAVIRKDSVCIDIYPGIEPLLLNRLVEALNYAQT